MPPPGRTERASREAGEHALAIGFEGATPDAKVATARYIARALDRPTWFDAFREGRAAPDVLLERYLRSRSFVLREAVPVELDLEREVEVIQAAQRYCCQALSRLEITVEANPSSNLLVAGFDGSRDMPAFRLRPLNAAEPTVLPVSVNDDDPITFATRLADEYAYLHAAMLEHDVAPEDALRWLDEARETGLRSRFTLPASRVPNVLSALLPDATARPPAVRRV